MFKIAVFFCIAIAVTSSKRPPPPPPLPPLPPLPTPPPIPHEIRWPEKYSFEITKMNVHSGLVLDMKIWRTETQSRIDYNNGAVKTITNVKRESKYEIYPEADSNADSSLQCHLLDEYDSEPYTVLPDASDDFILSSYLHETIHDEPCRKFTKYTLEGTLGINETLWVKHLHGDTYIPLRYENEQFNTFLGYVDRHEIWEFFKFENDFVDKSTFNVYKYCHSLNTIKHKKNSEAITKHLLFVDPNNHKHVDHVFKAFKKNHNKKYAHEKERAFRKRIFENNMRRVIETNRQNLGYKLAVNHLADRTPEELKRFTGLRKRRSGVTGTHAFPYNHTRLSELSEALPSEYDLRIEGYVSSVKNQEDCGSCWTFGTTAAVEGALARHMERPIISLANQALIDCAWPYDAAGCDGGSDNAAYEFMMKYGMPTETEYGTYADKDGFCNIKNMTTTYKIRGFVDVSPNSVGALKVALVNHGPLSVSVNVDDKFILYQSGVFYDIDCSPTDLNHEVALVGYGEYYGETYWIVKNSWGPEWGIDGYMHIAARNNNCGIMTEPTYVLF